MNKIGKIDMRNRIAKSNNMTQGFIPGMAKFCQKTKINALHHINPMKEKTNTQSS